MADRGRPCSVAAALSVVGERWALLVVRELLFGNHRFADIARNTAAPRDVLTARLRHLEAAGIVERRRYQDKPARYSYHLTEAGRDLAGVVAALRAWGDRWAVDEPPLAVQHDCGHPFDPAVVCRHCGREATARSLTITKQPKGWDLQGPVAAS
ncbi:transcriptional regulator, HxlR family [Pseudonocardia thermophila]|uniref:Transcriptional regulator, HxlR family n=1 Tax=Pseudonocardia thermophila TaxID=1848 RepID=A0A1M6WXE2_PSETH|nr:helix-turn-helix domain-containing protein [Pseudonocardia thermophila]SHK98346.1 transcriptional regulator, HxlR family [Pseudonocardia thermophila]